MRKLKGTPIVVNQWASWCGPCRFEFPFFQELAEKYEGRVAFLGVDSNDSRGRRENFLRENPVPYPSYFDPDVKIAREFKGGLAWPTTAFYDRKGKLSRPTPAPTPAQASWRRTIQENALRAVSPRAIMCVPSRGHRVPEPRARLRGRLRVVRLAVRAAARAGLPGRGERGGAPRCGDRRVDPRLITRCLIFVATFSAIFIVLGLSATAAGSLLRDNKADARQDRGRGDHRHGRASSSPRCSSCGSTANGIRSS